MSAVCPYCQKRARRSYGYSEMMVCVNTDCFFYLKDDVRNLDNLKEDHDGVGLIIGLRTPQDREYFVALYLKDVLILEAMDLRDKLDSRGVGRAVIRIKESSAEFYVYTHKSKEFDEIIFKKKYEEINNLKVRNWAMNKKIEVITVHLVISEKGLRVQAKHADTYNNLRSFVVPWGYF